MTRMAKFSLPPPAPSIAVAGDPPIPWANWLDSFTVYLDALGYDVISDEENCASPSLSGSDKGFFALKARLKCMKRVAILNAKDFTLTLHILKGAAATW